MQMAPQALEKVYFGSGNCAPIRIARDWLKAAPAPAEVRPTWLSRPEMAPQTFEKARFERGNGAPIGSEHEWLKSTSAPKFRRTGEVFHLEKGVRAVVFESVSPLTDSDIAALQARWRGGARRAGVLA